MVKRIMYLAAAALVAMLILPPAALAQAGDLDCSHFATQQAPQAILDAHPSGLDMYGLDLDSDRIACERLGGGALEDGTVASVQQDQATAAGTGGAAPLPGTGGPPLLLIPAAALLLACGILGFLAVGRRNASNLEGKGGSK